MSECSVPDCVKPVRGKGLCKAHHLRLWRHGHPLAGGPSRGHAKKFLLDHVSYTGDDCVIWPFARNAKGYADINFAGMKEMLAHRVMCVLAHGEPPEPHLEAAHSCGKGTGGCINPRHLSWKTRTENISDKMAHGTQIWGEKVHFAKLTFAQALRAKYTKEPPEKLASQFGVLPETIEKIRAGITWKGL